MGQSGRHPHPEALYYHIAGDALKDAKSEADEFRKAQLVTTSMVFSAFCLEVFINQVYHTAGDGSRITRMGLEKKWLELPAILGLDRAFDEQDEPFLTFHDLIWTRNHRLVHFKPGDEVDSSAQPLDDGKIFFSDFVKDVCRAEKYWNCVPAMIKELHTLTGGRTDLPNFLNDSRYTTRIWKDFTIGFAIGPTDA